MTTRLSQHRKKLVPAGVTLVLVILALVFWRPLALWFGVASTSEGDASALVDASAGSKPLDPGATGSGAPAVALPEVELPPQAVARVNAAFAATDQVRALLARDSLDGLTAQATSVAAALDAVAEDAEVIAPIRAHVASAADHARALAAADTIENARERFSDLSGAMVALAEADPRLAEGWNIFKCPMTEGHGKWFQRTRQLENPYMGQQMLTCGVGSDWELGATPEESLHTHPGSDEISHYTCPMHPSVKQSEPGACPICGMDLQPVTKGEVETGILIIDEMRRQRIGVRTAPVQKREMALAIRAVGEVTYDERRLSDVSLRMSGWVQKLMVDETGQKVKKGQTLFTLYSPELYAAQLEYLATIKRGAGASSTFADLARASKNRLRLLGMSDGQIAQLERRGSAQENVPIAAPASGYVIEKNVVEGAEIKAGTQVYRIADLDKIWIRAEVYEADLPHVELNQKVAVELPHVPGKDYAGTIDYIYPTLDEATRTGSIRVVLDNADLALKPDMYATVRIDVPLGERLAISESAVIYSGPRRIVFVDLGEGRLRPKDVTLGVYAGGYHEVVSGLDVGDTVVTSGNFLIASESRLRSATTFWGGDNGAK